MSGSPAKRQRRERFGILTAEPNQLMQQIATHVSSGHGLRALAVALDVPHVALWRWVREDDNRAAEYDIARKIGAATLIEQSIAELDNVERDKDNMPTSATVALAKARSDNCKWIAARIAPADWGESISISTRHHVTVSIPELLARREERLISLQSETYTRDDHTDFLTTTTQEI